MKKVLLMVPVCAFAFACNKTESSTTATTDASTASTTTATQASGPSAIVEKALSFLTGGPFEGAITMNNTSGDKPSKAITYEVKGTKMRFESPEDHGPMANSYVIFGIRTWLLVQDASESPLWTRRQRPPV